MNSKTNKRNPHKREDDENQLVTLYNDYYDKIANYVYARIGDKADAEDIASDVFMKALESLKDYEERGVPMQAWLFKIAHNKVVDHLRKITKRKAIPIETLMIRAREDPQDSAELNIEMERVGNSMASLTDDQAEVIRLRFFGGLSAKEIGNILDKSDGAVREMQRVALEKLRQLLDAGQE